MFETFNTPAMYVAIQAVLSLYASGRTTGEWYGPSSICFYVQTDEWKKYCYWLVALEVFGMRRNFSDWLKK
jgi:actin-related protein